jgi:hypothetical protein
MAGWHEDGLNIGMSDTMGDKDEKIVQEAKERFRRAEEWESFARQNYLFDMKFANGDSNNLYMWPDEIARARQSNNKPVLTINKTKQFCLQVINDQRQNPSQIQIRPVGNGASYDAAKVFEGICRHIEYQSQAQTVYSNACYGQVIGGIGYWRVVTEYSSDDSFDQEIYLRRIGDPLSVFLDNDIQHADGSDANWAFIYNDMPNDEFKAKYGEEALSDQAPLGVGLDFDGWGSREHTRVAEYFRRVLKDDKLYLLDAGVSIRGSEARKMGRLDEVKAAAIQVRDIEYGEFEWYLIAGGKIIDRKIWPGSLLPIVRCIGEETVIEKQLDRIGLTRCLIDPNRIYNFWSSSAVEQVALQTKTPYVTPVEAVGEFIDEWAHANVQNKAYLPYRSIDEAGNKIDRPEREPPPVMSQAYLDGMKMANLEMMYVSGLYEANMGMRSNEVSGKAVDARQRQGENATYHFIDRLANSIRYTGRILIDLIPKVYDSQRIVKILAINGDQQNVQIDPNQPEAVQTLQDKDDDGFDPDSITSIFNPAIGTYSVVSSIGPDYTTRREEMFRALAEIIQKQPTLLPVVGDLLFKAADFPMSDEIAKRLHNMVPPQALGQKGPDPMMQQLQQQLAEQHQKMMEQQAELMTTKMKLVAAEKDREIDEYKAETDRMAALGGVDPEAMKPIIRQLVSEALATPINPIIHQHAQQASELPLPAIEQAKLDHANIKLEQAKVSAAKQRQAAKKPASK